MENLNLSPTSYTPKVNFDLNTGNLEISGTATPEDSVSFFKPLTDWMEAYSNKPAPITTLIFRMDYFNTSSTVFFLRLMKGIARMQDEGKIAYIKWYHQKNDEDSIEAGKDFSVLAKIPVELIPF
jgi:hypothetical protein